MREQQGRDGLKKMHTDLSAGSRRSAGKSAAELGAARLPEPVASGRTTIRHDCPAFDLSETDYRYAGQNPVHGNGVKPCSSWQQCSFFQESLNLLGDNRLTEQEALNFIAFEQPKEFLLLTCLDTFGHDSHSQGVRQRDDR